MTWNIGQSLKLKFIRSKNTRTSESKFHCHYFIYNLIRFRKPELGFIISV